MVSATYCLVGRCVYFRMELRTWYREKNGEESGKADSNSQREERTRKERVEEKRSMSLLNGTFLKPNLSIVVSLASSRVADTGYVLSKHLLK